jgi:Domain of unknown function (DUF4260)
MTAFVSSRHPEPAPANSSAGKGLSGPGPGRPVPRTDGATQASAAAQAGGDPQVPSGDGCVAAGPRRWLRLEAAVVLAGCLVTFSTTHRSWWLVPLAILLPDVVMVGYLGGTRLGAIFYNAAHSAPAPAVVIALGWWQHEPLVAAIGLIWLAHIGADRVMGYGLKYDDHFGHTHLGRIGSTRSTRVETQT